MARSIAHSTRSLMLCIMLASLAACIKTVYVRTPGVCSRDSECLAVDEPKLPAETARAREREFVRRTVASTVTVRSIRYDGHEGKSVTSGTGTVIGSKGYVITAYHIVQGAQTITVTLRQPTDDGNFVETREALATPLISSVSTDMILLALSSDQPMPAPLAIRHDQVITGDRVWFLGERGPLSQGTVAQTDISDGMVTHFADAGIVSKAADNGAPVLNACGEVVGITLGPFGIKNRLRMLPIDDALESLGVTRADLR